MFAFDGERGWSWIRNTGPFFSDDSSKTLYQTIQWIAFWVSVLFVEYINGKFNAKQTDDKLILELLIFTFIIQKWTYTTTDARWLSPLGRLGLAQNDAPTVTILDRHRWGWMDWHCLQYPSHWSTAYGLINVLHHHTSNALWRFGQLSPAFTKLPNPPSSMLCWSYF